MTAEIEKVLAEATPRPWRKGFKADSTTKGKTITVWQAIESLDAYSVATVGCYQSFRGNQITRQIPQEQAQANADLITLAVNSYEADQEHIAHLERDCKHGEGMYVAMRDRCAGVESDLATAEERIRVLTEAVMAAAGMFQKGHCLEHFNWGASALTADDIRELNEVPGKLSAALSKTKAVPDNREVYPTGDDL